MGSEMETSRRPEVGPQSQKGVLKEIFHLRKQIMPLVVALSPHWARQF